MAEHMREHFTQALRARDALVRGDLAAMKQTAAWLADHRLAETLTPDRSPPQEVADLADRVHALGARGKLMTGSETRARLYGEYLASCDACHSKLGVRVPPRS